MHPDTLDLVVVEDTSLDDQLALPAKVDGLARALDVLGSRRSVTVVLIGPKPANAIIDRIGRASRVLMADVPEHGDLQTSIRFALAVLLPLEIEPAPAEPAESWRSVSADLRQRIANRNIVPVLDAAPKGSEAVTRTLRSVISENLAGPR